MVSDEDRPALVSLDQAARRLGVSPQTIRKLARQGRLQSTHFGRRHLIYRESVERLARAG